MKTRNEHSDSIAFIFLKGFTFGISGLSAFYYILLFVISGDPNHPLSQLVFLQPWMSLLILGFGIQFGLFFLLRKGFSFSLSVASDSQAAVGTSTAISGTAMVACCAHHLVDILPILGFSAAALFLSEYQKQFLIFGVVANALGIIMMLWFVTGRATLKVVINTIFTKVRSTL